MKTSIITSFFLITILSFNVFAQETTSPNTNIAAYPEKFGRTLNLGLGIGYYGYVVAIHL